MTGWGIDLDFRGVEWFVLKMNRDHSVIFETASKCCISESFVNYEGYSISSKGFFKRFFLKLIIFNWRIVTLHYCDAFCHTSIWISHWYICVLCIPNLPPCPILLGFPRARLWVPCFMHGTHTGHLFQYIIQCYSLRSCCPLLSTECFS